MRRALERLALRQHGDGGWGWWADDEWQDQESNPHISAYVVLGLAQAKAAGFAVDAGMLQRGGDYLRTQRAPIDVTTSAADANEQAFLAYVLAQS